MKKILLIIIFFFSYSGFGQIEKLKGNWISEENEMIFIVDTLKSENILIGKNGNDNFYLEIFSDTLSFQSRYYTSADNNKKLHTKRFDIIIIELNDSLLIAKPSSTLSENFFGTKSSITFKNQKHITDKNFVFDKLIFHTSTCFGSCKVIHFELLADKSIKLSKPLGRHPHPNSKQSYFIGKLPQEEYDKLLDLIIQSKITTFEDTGENVGFCCDGALKTIILYHNGKRKYYKVMFQRPLLYELISFLYQIEKKVEFQKTSESFTFEK